jgi:hypothetical protein
VKSRIQLVLIASAHKGNWHREQFPEMSARKQYFKRS